MNKILSVCLLLVVPMLLSAQQEPVVNKTFQYDERVHDFGTIKEKDGPVSHTFTFTNRGEESVVIADVSGWCGCTSSEYPRKPIAPGKTAEVVVTFNPYGRLGKFSKKLAVVLNGGKEYTRIWVKGTVIGYQHAVTEDHPYAFGEGLYMGFKVLPFGSLKVGEQYTFTQRIANDTDKEMVVEFLKQPNNRVLKMPGRIVLKPRERTTFPVSYRAAKEYPYDRHIMIGMKVNGKSVKPMRVTWFGSKQKNVTL